MRQKGKGVQLTGNLIKVEGIIKDGYVKCLKENIKLGLGYALFFNTSPKTCVTPVKSCLQNTTEFGGV